MEKVDLAFVHQIVHHRQQDGHKKTFGHVLVVAGSLGKVGAGILCARAALHAGCGLVTACIPEEGIGSLLAQNPEIMYRNEADLSLLDLSVYDAIAFGPGIGFSLQAKRNLEYVLHHFTGPIVFDADALTLLGSFETFMEKLTQNHILTPHPGEFTRLQGMPFQTEKKEGQCLDFVHKYPVQLVLKGAPSLVTDAAGNQYENTSGNDGMATAGSGDVLTGILASLCAQGYSTREAVLTGMYIHGLSGDLMVQKKSKASLVASDLILGLGDIRLLD